MDVREKFVELFYDNNVMCDQKIEGCHEYATCGTPTKDGYKRVCYKHYREIQEEA